MSFYFTDEAGKTWKSPFTTPFKEVKRFCTELNTYIKKYDFPKPNAADLTDVLQQAA